MTITRNYRLTILNNKKDGSRIWDSDVITDLKSKIKAEFLKRQNNVCCYCQRNIENEFKMVLDIEHILPKEKFPEFTLRLKNLCVACKRCNMKIKGNKINFLTDTEIETKKVPFRSEKYRIIHPNIDKYSDHLKLISIQCGINKLIYYKRFGTPKSDYTYDFFKLYDFEAQSLDQIQGKEIISDLSELFTEDQKNKIQKILENIHGA